MFNPFNVLRKVVDWFSEGISTKAKIILMVIALGFMLGVGFIGYKINDYFENDPKSCGVCHVHDSANEAWAKSKHASVGCHTCHHSTKIDQIKQLYSFVFLGHKRVSPRHGEIIVAWKVCFQCHWDRNSKFPNAPLVNRSRYHAKHVFIEQIECSKCHGYKIHQFPTEERFCLKCHEGKEVHGTGMEKLACLNCHTDRTADLRPGRKKCLFCHGDESVRRELIADGTIDVKHFQPSAGTIRKAIKVNVPADAPMQFYCYECHKPHEKARPDWSGCLKCHNDIQDVGKHRSHMDMGLKCKDCHKPHSWRVTEAQAKKECVKCHDYKEPKKFLNP